MTLHTSADAPITCTYWDELVDEDGFLALGRNRYHCSYVVYEDGTYIYAENGTTGELDYGGPNNLGGVSGIDASAVIQAALDGLTVGRTWKEKVVVKGDYVITTRITIPSYTIFDISMGGFILGDNVHMFTVSTNDYIDIIGGMLDGNKTIYATDLWCGIGGNTGCSYVTIMGTTAHDFAGKGFYIPCDYLTYVDCIAYSNGQNGFYTEGTLANPSSSVTYIRCISHDNTLRGFNVGIVENITFLNCEAYDNGGGTSGDGWNIEGGTGIGLDYYVINVKLIGCISHGNLENGYRIQMGVQGVSLIDCEAYENANNGLYLRGRDDDWTIYNASIIGGKYHTNELNGINCSYGLKKLKIIDVSTYNNDQSETNYMGIQFNHDTAEYVFLDNIHAYDDQVAPTQNRGVDFGAADLSANNIVCTNIYGEGNTVALWRGTVTETLYIQGYITENQGAGEVIAAAATSVVVAHGCSITPTAAEISVVLTNLPTNDIGDVYLSAIGAANFTINCRNVPGVATAIFSWAVRRV